MSLHPSRHNKIIYAKFNLKIHKPPPYKRQIWHYDKANADHIRKLVDLYPWGKALRNLSISSIILLYNKRDKNIISNYMSHETVIFDAWDPPVINKNAKQLILERNDMYKRYVKEN